MQANALHNIYHKYYQIIKVKKVMIYDGHLTIPQIGLYLQVKCWFLWS